MSLLIQALSVAVQEWDAPVEIEKLKLVRKPSPPPGRTRRLEAGDKGKLAAALSACRNPYVKLVFEFGLATGMRRGEILSLKWRNIDRVRQTVFLFHTKNGSSRYVPLSLCAIGILDTLAALHLSHRDSTSCPPEGRVFSITASALQQAWRRARKRAAVDDLRFHDLRHEAVSSFFEMGLSVPEVALITGHKDPRMLFRYTQLRAENVAKKLRSAY
jgi:integrase